MALNGTLSIDIARRGTIHIPAKQADHGYDIIITVLRNGVNIVDHTTDTASFREQKPDGTAYYGSATVNNDNTVTIHVDDDGQMLAVAGYAIVDLSIETGGDVKSTQNFVLDIQAAPGGSALESSSVFANLQHMYNTLAGLWGQAPAIGESVAKTAVASFNDGADGYALKDLTAYIEPVQTGSGDPSPDNIRPITGWTGCEVTRTGRNLFSYENIKSKTIYRATVRPMGEDLNSFYLCGANGATDTPQLNVPSWAYVCVFIGFRVEEETAITVSCKVKNFTENCNGYVRVRYNTTENRNGSTAIDTVFFNTVGTTNISISGIIPSGNYVFFEFSPASKSANTALTQYAEVTDFQVELGSTASDYEAYKANTYTIDWTDEAGTVYGGSLDVTTGVLTITTANIASYAGEALPSTWMSDRDVYAQGTTPTTGAQVVYTLADPVTVQLTPTEVTAFLNTNIWADTGDVSVDYVADTKTYIDNAIAAAINA